MPEPLCYISDAWTNSDARQPLDIPNTIWEVNRSVAHFTLRIAFCICFVDREQNWQMAQRTDTYPLFKLTIFGFSLLLYFPLLFCLSSVLLFTYKRQKMYQYLFTLIHYCTKHYYVYVYNKFAEFTCIKHFWCNIVEHLFVFRSFLPLALVRLVSVSFSRTAPPP